MTRQPTPLQWPEGWPRTPTAERRQLLHAAGAPLYLVTRQLRTQIRLLTPPTPGVRLPAPVITSNLPIDVDGLPCAGATADPGVAVYWWWRGIEHVIACDRWATAPDNIRACARVAALLRELGGLAHKALIAAIHFDLSIGVEADRYPLVAALADLHGGL